MTNEISDSSPYKVSGGVAGGLLVIFIDGNVEDAKMEAELAVASCVGLEVTGFSIKNASEVVEIPDGYKLKALLVNVKGKNSSMHMAASMLSKYSKSSIEKATILKELDSDDLQGDSQI